MALWEGKHRPQSLKELDCGVEQAAHLGRLVEEGDFPHLLVYGPPGSGKKTRVMCLLRDLYGRGVFKLRIEHQTFFTPSKKKIEISTLSSNYHIEVNASDVGIYDRVVIQELIKTVASAQQLNAKGQRDFKVVVLTEVDKLTKDAQHALRRTMEKYMSTCRVVLIAHSTSKVIPAIRSRCLAVRVPAPTLEDITRIIMETATREKVNMPRELAAKIAAKSERNLRRAVLTAEACAVQNPNLKQDVTIPEADWIVYIRDTASLIMQEQSPKRLLEVRGRLYELISHCITPDTIFIHLLKDLLKNCDGELRTELAHWAAFYEHRLNKGSKAIYHLEAFVAKFMSIHMKFMEEALGSF